MKICFYKYQSLGNDFILIDLDSYDFEVNRLEISKLCNRNFGIGADGVIFYKKITPKKTRMNFFNSDGTSASLCGNGLRTLFLHTQADNIDTDAGEYHAHISGQDVTIFFPIPKKKGEIVVEIGDEKYNIDWIDSGVDHAVLKGVDFYRSDLKAIAKIIRRHEKFGPYGCNVNFYDLGDKILMRTYERGVENFTLACGTGALAVFSALQQEKTRIFFSTGMYCDFEINKNQVQVTAEAKKVFQGEFYTSEFFSNANIL